MFLRALLGVSVGAAMMRIGLYATLCNNCSTKASMFGSSACFCINAEDGGLGVCNWAAPFAPAVLPILRVAS